MGKKALLLFVICLTGGCAPIGVARHVLKAPDGGVIALPSNAEHHRAKAHDLMNARFPEGYVIEKEEEVVTGQTTTQQTRSDTESVDLVGTKKKPFGSLDTTVTTRTMNTQDQTEIRIHYRVRATTVDTSALQPGGPAGGDAVPGPGLPGPITPVVGKE
jgi:hypothetical protein